MIKMDIVFRTLLAAIITEESTKKAPKLAATGKDQFKSKDDDKNPPKTEEPKIKMATPKLAPEEIPKTKGPASGFLNKVCINNPQIDNPEPTKTAVIAFGNLKLKIIISQLSLEVLPPNIMDTISSIGTATEPKLIFNTKQYSSITASSIKCFK